MGREIRRHGFRGCGEGGYAPSVAPLPEDAEIGLVGLACARGLFSRPRSRAGAPRSPQCAARPNWQLWASGSISKTPARGSIRLKARSESRQRNNLKGLMVLSMSPGRSGRVDFLQALEPPQAVEMGLARGRFAPRPIAGLSPGIPLIPPSKINDALPALPLPSPGKQYGNTAVSYLPHLDCGRFGCGRLPGCQTGGPGRTLAT
jgi:hypothetical protein